MVARPAVPRLHLVTNRHLCGDRSLVEVIGDATRGGLGAVQLREKDLPLAELLALAREVHWALGDTPLIVNVGGSDHADALGVAVAIGAAGVHLPGDAGAVATARSALGPGALIGRSVHSLAEAQAAEAEGADYAILGTIFTTASKPGKAPAGLDLVTEVARSVAIPIIAIGGIDASNVAATLRAGAWGVAVMSTILAAPDPALAVERLRRITEEEGA
jgi:thiamine-phosphate pyrophosphorylase